MNTDEEKLDQRFYESLYLLDRCAKTIKLFYPPNDDEICTLDVVRETFCDLHEHWLSQIGKHD